MNRSTSFLLPRLNVTEEPTFNQTISLADLTERPTESFQLSEDRATTEARVRKVRPSEAKAREPI